MEHLSEGELASVSLDFWMLEQNEGKKLDTSGIWDELKAFQLGWLACKKHYETID